MGAFSELAIDAMEREETTGAGISPAGFLEDITPGAITIMPQQDQGPKADTNVVAEAVKPTEAADKTESKDEASEDAKRKAHEEAEAKRKAEWDAKQLAKKQAEEAAIQKLQAMTDDEVIAASTQRVGADTEKLTRRNMKECVAEYIQTLCLEDPAFARLTMHPRKSMIRCFQYINRKAWEYIQDELKANGIKPGPGQQPYGCDIPDDLCFQWAVDYFKDPDVKEDHEDDEKFVPKTYYGGSARTVKTKDKKANKKKEAPKKPENKPVKKPADDAGQITLGGCFGLPEEKAG